MTGRVGGDNRCDATRMARKIVRLDKTHPATRDWPDGLAVVDEFHQFKNFDRAKVRSLPDMDFEGQSLPVAWVRLHGKGRVFYTPMGHRDDVMLQDIPSLDYGNKKENANEVSAAYQKHPLQGIPGGRSVLSRATPLPIRHNPDTCLPHRFTQPIGKEKSNSVRRATAMRSLPLV